jgi:endonuclease/exonuclease/phosphatase family metal-dependent hydrolase
MRNIGRIAARIKKIAPDIVLLQEVDGPSLVNGYIDHIAALQDKAGYPYAHFAVHTDIKGKKRAVHVAGTAILSKYPLENMRSVYFPSRFPGPKKGYAAADVMLPGGARVTLVSVHLALIASKKNPQRLHQSRLIIKGLQGAPQHPLIIGGDMNCTHGEEETIPHLMKKLGLQAYKPDASGEHTFPVWKPRQRIDWILPSLHFHFIAQKTFHDVASDHAGVWARLQLV